MDMSLDADIEQVARLTDGLGADGAIITAATPSDEVVSQAFRVCRRKGRVVLVGDVGLNLDRDDFYANEIDFLISTSYGPGRYDHRYEEQGLDYPAAYVRWTENRNMAEYLRLAADGRIDTGPLIEARYDVENAGEAYASLNEGSSKPLMVVLNYPESDSGDVRTIRIEGSATPQPGKIRTAVIGAGAFARATHLPNLQLLSDRFAISAIVSRTGTSAASAANSSRSSYSP